MGNKQSGKNKTVSQPEKHPVRPHSISFEGVQSLTKQSFKDECNVNLIVERFTRTGTLDHAARTAPQFGDAPDQSFFESSCIAAEAASAIETGLPDPEESETSLNATQDVPEDDPIPGVDDLDPDSAPSENDERSAEA